jgi:outer membrane biosynthesis protein TonB
VYTNRDAGVTEPVRIGPALPDRAGWPAHSMAVLEIVIDTRGFVESVHLRSSENRYRERWWVYAAKNWRFRPAIKDGRPVRFLKQISITESRPSDPQ